MVASNSGEVRPMAVVAETLNVASPLHGLLREKVEEVEGVAAVLRAAGFEWRCDDDGVLARRVHSGAGALPPRLERKEGERKGMEAAAAHHGALRTPVT
jgi:hypothetical protein